MNPLAETNHVFLRELRRNFRSLKGLVLLILSLIGGTGATLLLVKFEQLRREKLGDVPAELLKEAREKALTEWLGNEETGKYVAQAPEVLYIVLVLTVWLTPLLVALLGFDTLSGDLQHKSVRYWSVRSRRSSFYAGKFLGLWATVSTIILIMHAIIWGVCIARGEASAATTLSWGLRFWVVAVPIGAAWCGLAILAGSQFRVPMVSLLVVVTSFFVLWLLKVIGIVSNAHFLQYFYPSYWDEWMLSPTSARATSGLAVCLGYAVLTSAIGAILFQKRDV